MEDSQKPVTPIVTKHSHRPVVITILILSILVIAFAALFAFAAFGDSKSPVSFKKTGVCKDVIANYNASFAESDYDSYSSKLADSAKAAAAINNNESDANCAYIQLTNAVNVRNRADVSKYLNILKSLAANGEYITGELANPQGIATIELNAKSVSDGASGDSNGRTGGNG